MKIGFIDHYDSFSFNLVDWLCNDLEFPCQVEHVYWDDIAGVTSLFDKRFPLVFSPGPNSPSAVPASLGIMSRSVGRVPILGICLGFQMLGSIAGLTLGAARNVQHGSARPVRWIIPGVNSDSAIEGSGMAAVYNSLGFSLIEAKLSAPWSVIAADNYQNIQGILYHPGAELQMAVGLQFHPESFLSTGVEVFRRWWLQSVYNYLQTEF